MSSSIYSIRADFPIFSTDAYSAYLDNAATTHKPYAVIEAMSRFYSTNYAPVHRGSYRLAEQATAQYEHVRSATAAFINAQYASEIIFTKSATESINVVAYSWALNNIGQADEILISPLEHHANILPWRMVCDQKGARLIVAPLEPDGTIDPAKFINCISKKTKLISLVHMSHVTGMLTDIEPIIQAAQLNNVCIMLDAAQSVAHGLVDVQRYPVDFLAFSTHKVFGPTGLGILYIAQSRAIECKPFLYGGGMIERINSTTVDYLAVPHCFEAGSPPSAQVIGWGAALDYIKSFDWKTLIAQEQELVDYALEQLLLIDSVFVVGNPMLLAHNYSIISFNLKNYHHHDVAAFLSSQQCAVRAGNHCAQPLFELLNIKGSVRLSISIYSEKNDIDYLIDSLNKLVAHGAQIVF